MAKLLLPNEIKEHSIYKGLFYGQPGIGKSTLALSAPSPICLDFDRGMHRVQPQFRVPSLPVNNYQDVIDLLASEDIKTFDTIVVDTLGKLIDRLCDYAASKNPKARQGDGQMSMKGWGEVKNYFQAFMRLLEAQGKSIIFVAHESEERDGDETKKRPDCSGSARKDIVKELDFMGYMEMIGNKRTISFSPSSKFYAKNSLQLEGHIEIPDTTRGNNFVQKYIVKLTQDKMREQAQMREKYESLINMINGSISHLQSLEDFNNYFEKMRKKEIIWDSALYEKRLLKERMVDRGVEFDKETKRFIQKEVANVSNNANAA